MVFSCISVCSSIGFCLLSLHSFFTFGFNLLFTFPAFKAYIANQRTLFIPNKTFISVFSFSCLTQFAETFKRLFYFVCFICSGLWRLVSPHFKSVCTSFLGYLWKSVSRSLSDNSVNCDNSASVLIIFFIAPQEWSSSLLYASFLNVIFNI